MYLEYVSRRGETKKMIRRGSKIVPENIIAVNLCLQSGGSVMCWDEEKKENPRSIGLEKDVKTPGHRVYDAEIHLSATFEDSTRPLSVSFVIFAIKC